MIAPMLVPVTRSIGTPSRSSSSSTPMCAKPFAVPPPSTTATRGAGAGSTLTAAWAATCCARMKASATTMATTNRRRGIGSLSGQARLLPIMEANSLGAGMRKGWVGIVAFGLVMCGAAGCVLVANPSREQLPLPPAALSAQEVSFASASGSHIKAWLARGTPGSGAVLLFHGIGSNRTSMEDRAAFLHEAGFTVLMPDFEGHGESTGETVTYGAHESLDAAAALEFLKTVAPGERIGVIGVSM